MQTQRVRQPKRKLLPAAFGALVVAIVVIAALELTNTTHLFHKEAKPVTAGQDTKGEPQTSTSSKSRAGVASPSNNTQTGDNKNGSPSTLVLLTPFGDLVSSHHVSMSTPITSVCNTTPGADCTISFSSGGIVKSLVIETTDRGGSAYWNNWSPKGLGLTPGSWQIKAMATLSGQTKTTVDSLTLEVSS